MVRAHAGGLVDEALAFAQLDRVAHRVADLHAARVEHVQALDVVALVDEAREQPVQTDRAHIGYALAQAQHQGVVAGVELLLRGEALGGALLELGRQVVDALAHHFGLGHAHGRAAEVEALEHVHADLQQTQDVLLALHALGQSQGAQARGHLHEALDHLQAGHVPGHPGNQGAVQLQHIGPQKRDAVQVGVPGAHVVQGDEKAVLAVGADELLQGLGVLGP